VSIQDSNREGWRGPEAGVAVLIGVNDFAGLTVVQHQCGFIDQNVDDLAGNALIGQGPAEQIFEFFRIDVQHERWSKVIGSRILQALRARFAPSPRPDEAKAKAMVRVLFVCMGNICRSPLAEGVFRRMLEGVGLNEKIYVDSAGTHSYHVGAPPDTRSQSTALRRGVDLRGIRARRVEEADLLEFDYVLAMDRDNFEHLLALCQEQPELRDRIHLFLDFAPDLSVREVPDPYYGGPSGFERVMDLVEEAAQGLLIQIRKRYRI